MGSARGLLVKSPGDAPGLHRVAGPGDAGLRYLEFWLLNLGPGGARHDGDTGEREYALDVFAGRVTVEGTSASGETFRFGSVGGRPSPFEGAPDVVYLPPGTRFSVVADTTARLGIFTAPSGARGAAVRIGGDQAVSKTVGRGNWTRAVVTSVGDNVPAERLLLGETLNPPGNWSSAPPHKHDSRGAESEVPMEEIYYFRLDPPQGFGMMRVYTAPDHPDPLDEALVVENGDTVLIPRGYHPVAAAPGYRLHYTWGMAGEERRYGAWTEDPKHAWVRTAPA